MQVGDQGTDPAPETINGFKNGCFTLIQFITIFHVIQHLGRRPDTRQRVSDIVCHHGYQRTEGCLPLTLYQGVPAFR